MCSSYITKLNKSFYHSHNDTVGAQKIVSEIGHVGTEGEQTDLICVEIKIRINCMYEWQNSLII